MKIFFLDTNIFLQCKKLEELPWGEVSDDDILLLIPRAVQEEIDRNKQDGNSRRSKRARQATSFMRNLLISDNETITIKDSKPLVQISFSPPIKLSKDISDILDLNYPDDRIIAEALEYKKINPNQRVLLISHDTNILLTAKRCNLPFFAIPDHWLLQPEPDSRDKKIIELERQLKEVQKTSPLIKIESFGDSGDPIEELSFNLVVFEDFNGDELGEIIGEVKKMYPMETDFQNIPEVHKHFEKIGLKMFEYIPPSDKEIDKYQKEEYPNWLKQVDNFIRTLPNKLEMQSRQTSFSMEISNIGNFPAENVIFNFKALGGILFTSPEDAECHKNEIKLPQPPQLPMGQRKSIISSLSLPFNMQSFWGGKGDLHLFKSQAFRKRDKNGIYWKNEEPNSRTNSWIFECDEFRHRLDPESFKLPIIIPPEYNIPHNGAIECQISAKNLPEPERYKLPVKIAIERKKIEKEEVEKYLIGITFKKK